MGLRLMDVEFYPIPTSNGIHSWFGALLVRYLGIVF